MANRRLCRRRTLAAAYFFVICISRVGQSFVMEFMALESEKLVATVKSFPHGSAKVDFNVEVEMKLRYGYGILLFFLRCWSHLARTAS